MEEKESSKTIKDEVKITCPKCGRIIKDLTYTEWAWILGAKYVKRCNLSDTAGNPASLIQITCECGITNLFCMELKSQLDL